MILILVLGGGIWFGSHYAIMHRAPSPAKVAKVTVKETVKFPVRIVKGITSKRNEKE